MMKMALGDSIGGLSEFAGNIEPSNMFNSITPLLSQLGFFFKIFLYIAMFVFGIILFWKFIMEYKISITLLSRVGNGGLEVKRDKAKVVVDKQNKI